MANPSIDKIIVHRKAVNAGGGFDWDVEFTCVTSAGTRFPERKILTGLTAAQALASLKATAVTHDTDEKTPPSAVVKEFPLRYDATKGGLTVLDPADYPPTEIPTP